jgi:hypothetical protein
MAASGLVSIPSFETLIADCVFHAEPLVGPSVEPMVHPSRTEVLEQEDAYIELESTLTDKYTMDTLFVESWYGMLDDMEE